MSAAPARVVIAGAGEVAESYWLPAAAFLGVPATVLDLDATRAQQLAGRAGPTVTAAASLAEAAPGPDDVVVVATPPGSHGAVVREAVEAGARRVIAEKPPFVSAQDMDETFAVLARQPTAADSAFIRRGWRPVATARRLFPSWAERFGPLERVRITEGRPFGWRSRAAAERGLAGLSSMFLDEIPHALDALFGIARLGGATAGQVRPRALGLLDVDVDVDLQVDGRPVALHVLGSRTAVLPGAIDLAFERGVATVEMAPNGGIVVRAGSERTLLRCDGLSADIESMFAALLRDVAGRPLTATPEALEAWRGPLAVIERVQAAA